MPPAAVRQIIWNRDSRRCTHCQSPLAKAAECHLDRIDPKKRDKPDAIKNLRALCRRCACLRCHPLHGLVHEGMIAKAIADGVVPPDWRSFVWEG